MTLKESPKKQLDRKSILKSALVIFLPLFMILSVVIFFIYYLDLKAETKIFEMKEKQIVDFQRKIIASDFNAIFSHLMFLSELNEYNGLFEGSSFIARKALAKEFLSASQHIAFYDQIRFLDDNGMEIVRVNYNNGLPFIVPETKLQNKANRYYFKDTFKLAKGQIFVSPLDLNIERGEIEKPLKPMIRFGTPVFDHNGKKRGTVILNYLGKILIDKLKKAAENAPGKVMLLNSDGYWLHGPTPEDEWGFMFKDRRHRVFQNSYPEIWKEMSTTESGQVRLEDAIFTYNAVFPLPEGWKSSTGSGEAFAPGAKELDDKSYHWKIVSYLPMEAARARPWDRFKSSLVIYVLILIIIIMSSWALAAGRVRQRRDQAALREAEGQFRTIVEGFKKEHFFYLQDTHGVFTYLSPSVSDVLGRAPGELQEHFKEILTDNPINEAARRHMELTLQGKQQPSYELEVYHSDGGTRLLEVTDVPIFNEQGKVVGVGGVAHDITERKMTEESLRERVNESANLRRAMLNMMEDIAEARKEAEKATKAKSDFLANMSHEIRTPMNAVIGMAYLALKTELTAKQRDYLTKIQSSANSLLGIINDILDFSKIEAGKLDIESVDFHLDQVLDNLANLVTVKAREKEDLEVLFAAPPDVPRFLVGDPLRLGQVLINLANNAVKFTESGEIVVSTERVKQDEGRVTLKFSVMDTGIGLTREQISGLFEAFTQADSSTTRKFGGTGLGLTICKRLVGLMDGEIWVESEPGQGSTFSFTANFGLGREKDKRCFVPSPALKGMKVLVVDDNATSREILERILESFSFEVTLAASGEEGLAELESAPEDRPFDLVIMDWKMPGMDGIEASRRIKNHPRLSKIPTIVMVTAYGREEIMQQADQVGLEGFLIKPVSPSVLFDTIMQALGQERSKLSRIAREKERVSGTLKNIKGARVLLVEDNEINRQVAREILSGAGLKVSLAYDGQEAVDAVQENEYDIVLMDVQMPVMDGYEATRAIRSDSRFKKLPIIAMTAHAMASDREKSLEAGMNDHVSKPIDPETLYRTLEKWVDKFPADESDRKEREKTGFARTPDDSEEMPELDGVNVEAGLKRLLGNKKTYRRILLQFCEGFQDAADALKSLVSREKLDEAEKLVHTLKGAGANIGAEKLQWTAATLEKFFRDGGKGLPGDEYTAFSKELGRVLNSLSLLKEKEESHVTEEAETGVLPPEAARDIAQRLRNALEVGDVTELSIIASDLRAQTDPLSRYGEKIAQLADKFDFDGLLELANALHGAADH